jgi:hypothetical protein
MPRHPPCALDNLTNTPTPATTSSSKPKTAHTRGHARPIQVKKKDARVHSALDNHTRRPPPPTRKPGSSSDCPEKHNHPQDGRPLRTQQCADVFIARTRRLEHVSCFLCSTSNQVSNHHPEEFGMAGPPAEKPEPAGHQDGDPSPAGPRRSEVKLLRKEVIQPHLPVRLPCYDFVPIASPTFDRSPPCGLGHGLRVLPTFVT